MTSCSHRSGAEPSKTYGLTRRNVLTPWITFINERFPLVVYSLLSLGFTASAYFLAKVSFALTPVLVSTLGQLLFFFTLRLMDEFKDYQKDLVAHPERPLPRGLISLVEAGRAIHLLMALMCALSFVVLFLYDVTPFLFYLITTIYLYFMFKEFFIGKDFQNFPLTYALSHQIILFPLVLFSLSIFSPFDSHTLEKFLYAAMVFFAFFSYEICRRLDPDAPTILGTYWKVSGKIATSLSLALLIFFTILAAADLFHTWLIAIVSLSVLLAFLLFLLRPSIFKLVEAAASISLLFHIWSVGIWRLLV